MIEIIIPEQDYEPFDSDNNVFLPKIHIDKTILQLEHSLISLKKWEQRWHKPFLRDEEKTVEQIIDYIHCMTLTHGVDPNVYNYIPIEVMEDVIKYIKDPMTATWFTKNTNLIGAQKNSNEIITAEIIYYWMITLNIPVEFQKWHLNQLLTLIKVVSMKNGKQEKVDPAKAAKRRAELNRKRRAEMNSRG